MPILDSEDTPTVSLEPAERFARLWTRAQPRVAAYIRSLVPDPHCAEDILQDVAVACMQKMEAYDTSRSFKAWCVGVARIQILRQRREDRRHRLLAYPDILETVADVQDELDDEMNARTEALRQCVKKMSEKTRQMLDMRYTEGRPLAAIASLRRLRANSVKVMLSRARAWLRKCIEKRLANDPA